MDWPAIFVASPPWCGFFALGIDDVNIEGISYLNELVLEDLVDLFECIKNARPCVIELDQEGHETTISVSRSKTMAIFNDTDVILYKVLNDDEIEQMWDSFKSSVLKNKEAWFDHFYAPIAIDNDVDPQDPSCDKYRKSYYKHLEALFA